MQRRPTVVLWGAGMIAEVHASACQALDWPVAAVASRRTERAQSLAVRIGARACAYDEVVGEQLGDLAIVATPPGEHVDAAIRLLDAGYQVVVEAPVACTLADADRLVQAEQRSGRSVLYSEHLAASPAVDTLLTRVASIGALTHLSARALQPPPNWRSSTYEGWGGGASFDLGVHPVGLALRTASEGGAGAPISVHAIVNDAGSEREHASIKLRFASGLIASITAGWQPRTAPDWDLQASSASGVLRAELYPSPTLEHNGDIVSIGVALRGAQPSLVDDYGYAPQLKRFWTSVRTGRPVPVTSQFGRLVLEVISAAHWSAGHNAIDVDLPFAGPRDLTPNQLLGR